MIVDNIPLAGSPAKLLSPSAQDINLVSEKAGHLEPILDGQAFEIDGLSLYVEGPDLLSRLKSSAPLFEINLTKEVAPDLFLDPYAHRIHTVGGGADFSNGLMKNCVIVQINGRDTLVSTQAEDARWRSARYQMNKPTSFAHAAWELDASQSSDAFEYSVTVDFWTDGQSMTEPPTATVALAAPGTTLDKPRVAQAVGWPGKVVAFQLHFGAKVHKQSTMSIRTEMPGKGGLGHGLLRAIALAEATAPLHHYISLAEVMDASVDAQFIPNTNQPVGFVATLDFSARLEEKEKLSVAILDDTAFTWFEMRLNGTELRRPHMVKSNP